MPYVEKLKMIKEKKDLTNAEIATLSNIPLPTITRVFNGSTLNPTFETIAQIAIGMGVSLDELVGLKQPDAPPISSPVEDTLNSYSELLKEKDDRIKELIEDKKVIRKEKYKVMWMLVVIVTAIFTWFIIDIMNGHFGAFRY
jgi:transcriptional regulator with XRE-family HTH domain